MCQTIETYIWLVLLFFYCGLIYWLSGQSHLPVPDVFDMQDKLIHATAYAVMALLFWQAWRRRLPRYWLVWMTVLFCSVYGISDEWHQSFTPGRDASTFDWLADTLGAFLLTMALYKREFVVFRHK